MSDFVTFELAKKLKEKGFRKAVNAYYDGKQRLFDVHPALDMNDAGYRCSAPTISQVLKWLREEKKLHIELWIVGKKPIKWCHTITTLNHVGERQGWSSGERGDSYEAAAIVGIEYCLDNLI